jgi:small subunit ribosomal protein S6
MRSYELMMIHRPDLAEADVRTRIAGVEETVNGSGQMETSDFWGKRRFAYVIDHLTEGYYSVLEFKGEPDLVAALDRSLSLSDEVVRHKILRRFDKES